MKKKLIGIVLVVILVLSITGCRKTPLVDQVADYHKLGVEDGTTNWNVTFSEDCNTSKYDASDFAEVIAQCIEDSSTSKVCVNAFDSDNIIRFSWDSLVPMIVTQYEGNAPNIRTNDEQLEPEDYKKISEAEK